MPFPEEIHVNFNKSEINYDINLVKGGKSNYSVKINGFDYSILGDNEKLEKASQILNSISRDSVTSLEDLKGRLSQCADLSFPIQKITTIGLERLQLTSVMEPKSKGLEIDEYIENVANTTSFRGSILIAKGNEILLNKGYGNATLNEKNTASTIFHIGSVTKQFTAAAVMKLVEKGLVDVNEKAYKYLPKLYQSEFWKEITVKELLSHTSGLSNYTDDPEYFNNCLNLTKEMLIKQAMEEPLMHPRGELHYSNTGYLLLGALIEEQSKVSYGEFMQTAFFTKAKMDDTGVHDINYHPKPHTALGFCPDETGENLVEDKTENLAATCGADGAIYSSLKDLMKWSQLLDQEGILKKSSLQEMKTPVKDGYGYGLQIEQQFGTTKICHEGLVPGFSSSFIKYPEKGIFIAILGNNGKFPSGILTDHISEILLEKKGEAVQFIPHDFQGDSRIGLYKSTKGSVQMEFYEKKGRLFMKGLDGPDKATECLLQSDESLFLPEKGLTLVFKEDTIIVNTPTGVVDELSRVPNNK